MGNRILYLENDDSCATLVEPELTGYGHVKTISTESEFRQAIDTLSDSDRPSLIILEQIVKWAEPAPNVPKMPHEVWEGGYENAGIRCYEYLRKSEGRNEHIPVIIFSTYEPDKFRGILHEKGIKEDPKDIQYVNKSSELAGLHQAINRVFEQSN